MYILLNSQSSTISTSGRRSLNQCFTLACNTATTLITAAMVAVSTTIARLTAFVLIAIATAVPRPLSVSKAAPVLSTQIASRRLVEYKTSNELSKFVTNVYVSCKDRPTQEDIYRCIKERSPIAAYCVRKYREYLVYCRNEVVHSDQDSHGCIFYKC